MDLWAGAKCTSGRAPISFYSTQIKPPQPLNLIPDYTFYLSWHDNDDVQVKYIFKYDSLFITTLPT